ncbi:N-acetyltransferase [Amnibacterium flavum]|uniref:N-acetyltransferase n=2 Tax=Amnibacterium flavum TaxID=2173173 RepID=A0A2V1HZ86_9MICO|nr:N-acetyltransferase [Amnibacterium flavum]
MPLALPRRGRHVAHRPSPQLSSALRSLIGVRRPRFLRGPRMERRIDAPVLTTARLTLRPHRIADAEDWFAIQSSAEVVRHIDWPLRDRAASRLHLRDRTRHTSLLQPGDFLALAVVRDGRLIGDVSLHLREIAAPERVAEIGWVFNPDTAGKGYATEAAEALLRFAATELRAVTVTARIRPQNHRSIALAQRLGFDPDATGEVWSVHPGLVPAVG